MCYKKTKKFSHVNFLLYISYVIKKLIIMNIKSYYQEAFPEHKAGSNINPNADFKGLFNILKNYNNACIYLGVDDLLILERVFTQLAKQLKVSYIEVYAQHLMAD